MREREKIIFYAFDCMQTHATAGEDADAHDEGVTRRACSRSEVGGCRLSRPRPSRSRASSSGGALSPRRPAAQKRDGGSGVAPPTVPSA